MVCITRPDHIFFVPKRLGACLGVHMLLLFAAFVNKRRETPDLSLPRSSKVHPVKAA